MCCVAKFNSTDLHLPALPAQESIENVVRLVWRDNREVPHIAGYHKEAAGELLAMRGSDAPETTTRAEALRRADRQQPDQPEGTVQVCLGQRFLLSGQM